MLGRIGSLFPSLRSVGWFLVGWTVLANASTGVFAIGIFGSVSKWLDAHAWVGLVLGLGLLASSVAWPEIRTRPWFVRLKLPKTPYEKLGEKTNGVVTALNEALRLQSQFNEGMNKANELSGGRLLELERVRTESIEPQAALIAGLRGIAKLRPLIN